jgi:hypothetical protein
MSDKPEVWLRGPLAGVPGLLQPVAHALLQAREEIDALMKGFPEELLWERPAGLASPGFHLQHLAGVINRLFTYARGEQLTPQQLEALAAEGKSASAANNIILLTGQFGKQVDEAIIQLKNADMTALTEKRAVGRAKLPATVIGLYIHAAEHTMRHVGQLLVTIRVLTSGEAQDLP